MSVPNRTDGAAGPLTATGFLADALEAQKERLLPCVHCGFCLPACPTYTRLGDEADSPRGRLHLMQAVVEGRLDAGSDAFQTHIDRCLGCRACEPVCPSGVEYGALLEVARDTAAAARPPGLLTRLLLRSMGSRVLRGPFFLGGRLLRGTGLAALGAKHLPSGGVVGKARFALAMLDATSARGRPVGGPTAELDATGLDATESDTTELDATEPESRGRVAVLTGCVQAGLYARINRATIRTLEANGYEVVQVVGQDCCGALHAHGGDLTTARDLARCNMSAFGGAAIDHVVVNAAGCGAAMKEYRTWFERDAELGDGASDFSGKVRDVTELLAEAGPRRGATVETSVAYDHPCHLLHAQRVRNAPLQVLAAVPGVDVRIVAGADECCGGAGIYGMTHPELGGQIGGDKVQAVMDARAEAACTPNPGCMMQIGAGLRLRGAEPRVVHPVELLDESYERAGYYR